MILVFHLKCQPDYEIQADKHPTWWGAPRSMDNKSNYVCSSQCQSTVRFLAVDEPKGNHFCLQWIAGSTEKDMVCMVRLQSQLQTVQPCKADTENSKMNPAKVLLWRKGHDVLINYSGTWLNLSLITVDPDWFQSLVSRFQWPASFPEIQKIHISRSLFYQISVIFSGRISVLFSQAKNMPLKSISRRVGSQQLWHPCSLCLG